MNKAGGNFPFILVVAVLLLFYSGCALKSDSRPIQPHDSQSQRQDARNENQKIVQPAKSNQKAQQMADSVSREATKVNSVKQASTIILGNTALIGLTLDNKSKEEQRSIDKSPLGSQIKDEVARRVEKKETSLTMVSVTADPDLTEQIEQVVKGLRQGAPLSEYWDKIGDILQKVNYRAGGLRD